MQKQNHSRLFATDLTPSSHDQNDHQSVDDMANHSCPPHNNTDIVVINNNNTNENNDYGVTINRNYVNNNPTNNNDSHILVPSHYMNIDDNLYFDNFQEDSLFADENVYEKKKEYDCFEHKDNKNIDDDKYFQPIPPSPFEYEEETTDNYNYNDTIPVASKSRDEDDEFDRFELDSCLSGFLGMNDDLYNFSPFESSTELDIINRNESRDVENSFHRSESFASTVLSEHNNGFDFTDENDGFDFLDDIEEDSQNCLVISKDGANYFDSAARECGTNTSENDFNHEVNQRTHSHCNDTGFGDNLGCDNSFCNFSIDERTHPYVTSLRKRIASGGNKFTKNLSNEENNFNRIVSPTRKRMASGDVASYTRLKIPRRCSSLGNEQHASSSFPSPYSNHGVSNRSVPSVSPSSFYAANSLSETSTTKQSFDFATTYQTRNEKLFSNVSTGGNDNWINQETLLQCNDFGSSNSDHSSFKPPIVGNRSTDSNNQPQTITSVSLSDSINNNTLNYDVCPDVHSVPFNSQLLPSNNEEISHTDLHIIPSHSSSVTSPSPLKAANKVNDSHPFTVRSLSATTFCNEITSTSAFIAPDSNKTSRPINGKLQDVQSEQILNLDNAFSNVSDAIPTIVSTITTCNSTRSKLSSDQPTIKCDIFTVPEMICNNGTIGFPPHGILSNAVCVKREESISDKPAAFSLPVSKPKTTSNNSSDVSVSIRAAIQTVLEIPQNPLIASNNSTSSINNKSQVVSELNPPKRYPSNAALYIPSIVNTPEDISYFQGSNNSLIPVTNDNTYEEAGEHQQQSLTLTPIDNSQNQHDVKCSPATDDPALEKAYNECLRTGTQTLLIKEELKRKIMYKRCVQGMQEVPSDPAPSPSSNQLTDEEKVKRKRRLEANRLAAAKMRSRRKEQQEELTSQCRSEEDRKAKLLAEIERLQDLKNKMLLLLSHFGICIETTPHGD